MEEVEQQDVGERAREETEVNISSGLEHLMQQAHRYQQNLNTAEDVHGARKSGAQVEADPNSATKLGPQGARDHVI